MSKPIFIIGTQKDKGVPKVGDLQLINAHSAQVQHARNFKEKSRRKSSTLTVVEKHKRELEITNQPPELTTSLLERKDHRCEGLVTLATVRQQRPSPTAHTRIDDINPGHNPGMRIDGDSSIYESKRPWLEITSILDPFIQLPVGLSSSQQNLLQFHLTDKRTQFLGTSENPAIDLVLEVARMMMHRCPVWSYSRITAAEMQLCVMRGKDLSMDFFKAVSSAYREARIVLSKERVLLEDRFFALFNLLVMEMLRQEIALIRVHLQALQTLLQSDYTVKYLLEIDHSSRATWLTMLIMSSGGTPGAYASNDSSVRTHTALRIVENLHSIRGWTLDVANTTCYNPSVFNLEPLFNYLRYANRRYAGGSKSDGLGQNWSITGLIFAIGFCFARMKADRARATKLLASLQRYMVSNTYFHNKGLQRPQYHEGSPEAVNLTRLHVGQVYTLFHHIRCNEPQYLSSLSSATTAEEVYIYRATVNAANIAFVISTSTLQQINEDILECLSSVIKGYRSIFGTLQGLPELQRELKI